MNAFIFPGQGAQFSGMGLDMYEKSPLAQELFEKANDRYNNPFINSLAVGALSQFLSTPLLKMNIANHHHELGGLKMREFFRSVKKGQSWSEFLFK